LILSGLESGHWGERVTSENGNRYTTWVRSKDADLHWHDLGHECGSRLAEHGCPLHEIKELLGHKDLKQTEQYLNPKHASMADNLDKVYKRARWK
jgi:integrase